MTDSDDIHARVSDIESRFAFQEDTIDTLNQLVTEQNDRILQLEAKLKLLGQRLQQVQERDEPNRNNPLDERPPHY